MFKYKHSSSALILVICVLVYTLGMRGLKDCASLSSETAPESPSNAATASVTSLGGCKRLGLPQPMENIPLSASAYEFDHSGTTTNFFVATADRDVEPPVLLAMPNEARLVARIRNTGRMEVRDNGGIWTRIKESDPADGIFIDVGGWVGDTSIPSAAVGIETYVFEPVRNNSNLIHFAVMANGCHVSEHITIVNALVGDRNSKEESVYVTSDRADNAAATREQATLNIDDTDQYYYAPVEMVKLDTFFPPGTRVQNLKIDVQGNELHVLRGAERILKENRERLHLRFEYDEKLLTAAGTNPSEVMNYMQGLGYRVTNREGEDVDMRTSEGAE